MNVIVMIAFVAFVAQSSLIAIDEFVCHRMRTLPKWELIGHPIDTFCLWIYLIALRFLDSSSQWPLIGTAILGLVSCFIITKDEWVHKEHATAFENWLHAMLFVLHPAVVLLYYYLWYEGVEDFEPLLHMSVVLVGGYFFYQSFMGLLRWRRDAASEQ
jgi:hypothetical protein